MVREQKRQKAERVQQETEQEKQKGGREKPLSAA